MTVFYVDSSVLVKRHIPEAGSLWVESLFDFAAGNTVFTSHLSNVEVVSALNRRVREGSITSTDCARLRDDFLLLCNHHYHMVQATSTVMVHARQLLERYALRAYDALHLSCAIVVNNRILVHDAAALVFLAADDRLLAAAASEGLAVDNPNNH